MFITGEYTNIDSLKDSSLVIHYNYKTLIRGYKHYELSNHLGNVLVVISDKRITLCSSSVVSGYEADVVSASDFYPFGMLMSGRSYSSPVYRYGFNGKERTDEINGEGNVYDYGYRIYNPCIGKFLSVDPLIQSYPWYTPYQFAGNKPIWAVDLDGLEETGYTMYLERQYSTVQGAIKQNEANRAMAKAVTVALFKSVFSEQLPKNFIDHYAYGNGKQYTLNKSEAVDIRSIPTGLKGIVDTDKEKFNKLISVAKKGSTITLPEGYSIQGGATTGGTLGRFTTSLTGKITIDKKDVTKWTFEGTMQFNDIWDFKTNFVTNKDLQRSEWGDIQTKLADKYLPGQGFNITSEVMQVKQTSFDASFDWYNGKAADGKQNEISNDMKDHPQEAKEAIKKGKSGG